MTKTPLLTSLGNIVPLGQHSKIAGELTALVQDERAAALLRSRFLLGTIKKYGISHDQSLIELSKWRTASREEGKEFGAFVVRTSLGKTIGLASVQPALDLRRYRELPILGAVPLAPRLAHRTLLVATEPTIGSAVEVWTAPGYGKELREAYEQLSDPDGISKDAHLGPDSWVLEPKDAPLYVHKAITAAGYSPIKTAHFEHDRNLMDSPPLSVLHQRIAANTDH